MSLPQGVVRGLVARLERAGRVKTDRDGCRISPLGEESLRAELAGWDIESLREFPGESLGIGPVVVAAHLRRASHKVKLGIEQRDLSVRTGAKGAVTLVCEHGILRMPGVSQDLSGYAPQASQTLLSRFDVGEGDVVLLVFADNYYRALEGALSAATGLA